MWLDRAAAVEEPAPLKLAAAAAAAGQASRSFAGVAMAAPERYLLS